MVSLDVAGIWLGKKVLSMKREMVGVKGGETSDKGKRSWVGMKRRCQANGGEEGSQMKREGVLSLYSTKEQRKKINCCSQ